MTGLAGDRRRLRNGGRRHVLRRGEAHSRPLAKMRSLQSNTCAGSISTLKAVPATKGTAERMQQAELFEIQGNYEQSVAKYDSVLKRNDVPRVMRAAAKNNLGFLLTLLNERTEEAEQLINEAMEVYGPVSDILDTRAIVRMTRKEYDQAVEDMSLATSLSDDPVKFYHYAQANLLAGNDQAALKAWDKAQKLGITKEKLPVLEQKNFDQVKSEIGRRRPKSATRPASLGKR